MGTWVLTLDIHRSGPRQLASLLSSPEYPVARALSFKDVTRLVGFRGFQVVIKNVCPRGAQRAVEAVHRAVPATKSLAWSTEISAHDTFRSWAWAGVGIPDTQAKSMDPRKSLAPNASDHLTAQYHMSHTNRVEVPKPERPSWPYLVQTYMRTETSVQLQTLGEVVQW